MKFATKLTALFSVVILGTGVLIAYFVYATNVRQVESLIRDRLQNQAFHTLAKVDLMFFERYGDIKTIADDPVVSSAGSTPAQITRRLISYRDNYKYESISFFNLNRVRLADTSGKELGKQHPLAGYWKDLEAGKDSAINIAGSESLKKPVLHIASIIKNKKGIPFGVIVLRVPIERLYGLVGQIVGTYEIGKDIKMDMLNDEGLILYSDYNENGILKEISPDWQDIKESIRQGKKVGSGRHFHPKIGDEIHAYAIEQGYLNFKGNDWILVLHTPAKLVYGPAQKIRNEIIFVTLVILILCALLVRYVSIRITRPIVRLSSATEEIGKGNFDVTIDAGSKDEIGELSVSLGKMAKSLQDANEGLLAYSNELEAKVIERTAKLKLVNEQLHTELEQRRQAEEDLLETKAVLEMHNHEMRELGEMTELLQTCYTLEDAYNIITQTAVQLFPSDSGVLLTFNDSSNLFELAAEWGKTQMAEQKILLDECWAARCGRMHVVKEGQGDLPCRHTKTISGIHLCMPVTKEKGKTTEVIHLLVEGGDLSPDDEHLGEKERVLANMAGRIGVSLANLKLRESLHELSIRDQLTGLFNRRFMEESLERELNRAERNGSHLGVVMLDIDHFKKFNDTLGHAAGDELLHGLGKFLQQHIRGSDIACRYGGEEFLLIMPEATLAITQQRAEHLREAVKFLQVQHEEKLLKRISLSLGVAVFPDNGSTTGDIIQAADKALYKAKHLGRNMVCLAERCRIQDNL